MDTGPTDIFRAFAEECRGRRLVVACQADAAGLAAGEIARRHFAAAGRATSATVLTPGKGELLTGQRLAERGREVGAQALLALDLGAAAEAVLADVPALFIDLHRHQANLSAPVIEPTSDAGAKPAGVVLYEILRHRNEGGDAAWLAMMAAESGHPKTSPPEDKPRAGVTLHKTAVREVAVLLNSATRASRPQTDAALALLARNPGAQRFLSDESPELEGLREARGEVLRAVGQWSRTRPHFMWRVALVPIASPCRIEPILAAMWERQLDRYMVVVANSGYAPDRVTVVARTASPKRNLLRLLDAVTPQDLADPIALGRRDYVEAVVPLAAWESMLRRMRFHRVRSLIPPPQEATLF